MDGVAIRVKGLRKSYGSVEAVDGIDFEVRTGEVFALLGPNGAGKTTTVEILEGHRARTAGDVAVLGHDPGAGERAFKQRIGIVLQERGVERFLTVAEVVDLYRGYYPDPLPTAEILELVGLGGQRDQLVRRLSGGQQRRLDVAVGLAGDPDLLFLDEPTTGFDPSARRNAWKMISDLKSLHKTVLLTTHYMDEAHTLSDRVAIIVAGRIVAAGDPATLSGRDPKTRIRFAAPPGALPPPRLGASVRDGNVEIATDEPERVLNELTGWALDNGVRLAGLSVAQQSLEDVYLELTEQPE